jgi:hypothetical protein
MKICISEDKDIVNIETDDEFNTRPWTALDFIADAISRLQSLAIDIEMNAGDPAATG